MSQVTDWSVAVVKIQANVCQFPKANEGEKIKILALTLDVICAIVTFLRFMGKKMSGQRLTWDDYILGLVVVCWGGGCNDRAFADKNYRSCSCRMSTLSFRVSLYDGYC
jgi:hypothetical protein